MARRRHATNPAKVRADLQAAQDNPPAELFQRRVALRRRASVVLLNLLSVVLLTVSFAPTGWWLAAFIALAPWCAALGSQCSRRWVLLWAWLAGVLFWMVNLYWLTWITLAGYFALAAYLSAYWLVAAVVVRAAIRRQWGMWIVLPVVWVALEFARAHVISGFPWFFLAHSQYAQIRLIQIADATGQYGVSFLVAMVNGALVDVFTGPLFARRRGGVRLRRGGLVAAGATILAVGAALGYGTWRLSQETRRPGPVIGLVQHAFPITLHTEDRVSNEKIFSSHIESTARLVGAGCDLVIWPETMLPDGLNPWVTAGELNALSEFRYERRMDAERVAELSRRLGCPILAGGGTYHPNPDAVLESDRIVYRNSALWFDGTWRARTIYSKIHLVPFGEYVPFRDSWPWLHRFLRSFVPPVMSQLVPGDQRVRFRLDDDGRQYTLATPICYEGVFARDCRKLVMAGDRKVVDIIANMSNDGWFVWNWGDGPYHGSTEQPQHLVQYCFRAVENRTPVVRAVNTGISASIDSNGRIVATVSQYGARVMVAGTLVLDGEDGRGDLPAGHGPQVLVDGRVSVYSLLGDAFAMLTGGAAIGMVVWMTGGWVRKRKEVHRRES